MMIRDLNRSILRVAQPQNVDMADILKFPRTPVLLALSLSNGCTLKTNLSILLKNFASQIQLQSPPIFDAMLILISNMPEVFEDV